MTFMFLFKVAFDVVVSEVDAILLKFRILSTTYETNGLCPKRKVLQLNVLTSYHMFFLKSN